MKKEWDVVEVLKYARHDWLNKIQLIKGNLALNRVDRANDIINTIVNESQHESKLTSMNMHLFTGFVMTYHWYNHAVRLELEVLGNAQDLSKYDNEVYKWCRYLTGLLESHIDYHADNYLSISLCTEEQEPRFFFDFSGILTDMQNLQEQLGSYEYGQMLTCVEQEILPTEFNIQIKLNT
ncbi:sporulation initiation phosphotransferase B [Priestia flexa]|jgi:stage 0 sporulation protein B (sporulation initiation phosphotransferase)|uniref:Sporulation protein n=2 Tax=Priestia TaxID=2800373 RepID=A0A0V8JNC7_9BACI|nr:MULTISPECIES: Spo0B C-terminal domain-containing protein [Bacillaceae]AQX53617.1 sporulation protein [Priestia flexa]KSU88518.1 sporulation protein [Priestia veravalensis]KZB92771.1 sporulation protein [Bacillus sp. VT 712]MBN8250553.1 Spo0B domain-containing protein [Priestia flexa]MBN8432625.1 Spo0B domain-containing protein [Priestia flexa]